MEIVEYSDKYLEDVRDLLVELEEYILSIDKDNLDNNKEISKLLRENNTKEEIAEELLSDTIKEYLNVS